MQKWCTSPQGSMIHSQDQQPYRQLNYSESQGIYQTRISKWILAYRKKMKVPVSVHTNKCFLEALSTIFFNYKLTKICGLPETRKKTCCFDTSCLCQSYTQIFSNTEEKKIF